ncbi:hypothetical protein J6590_035708 [Homalodisca vitripennis]|nr:hypothetical protein J6590_035708 [Homalodisca vitripennis]
MNHTSVEGRDIYDIAGRHLYRRSVLRALNLEGRRQAIGQLSLAISTTNNENAVLLAQCYLIKGIAYWKPD